MANFSIKHLPGCCNLALLILKNNILKRENKMLKNFFIRELIVNLWSVNDVCASLSSNRVFSLAGITIGKPKDKRTLVGGLFNLCEYENMNTFLRSDKLYSLLTTKLIMRIIWLRQSEIQRVFKGTFSLCSFMLFLRLVPPPFFSFEND